MFYGLRTWLGKGSGLKKPINCTVQWGEWDSWGELGQLG